MLCERGLAETPFGTNDITRHRNRAKARARVDFLLVPTRGSLIQAGCDRPSRDFWPVERGASAACAEAAGREHGTEASYRRCARGDCATEGLERSPRYQAEWHGAGND